MVFAKIYEIAKFKVKVLKNRKSKKNGVAFESSLFKAYKRALKIECQITNFQALHRVKYEGVAWLPHAQHLTPISAKVLSKIRLLVILCLPLYYLLALPILIVRDLAYIVNSKEKTSNLIIKNDVQSLFLGTSIAEHLESISATNTVPNCYLKVFWRSPPRKLPKEIKSINFSDQIEPKDLGAALKKFIKYSLKISISPSLWHLNLYSYMGFRWLLMFEVIKKIGPSEVWISNHYDRWTVLVEYLELDTKVMVQHGLLDLWSKKENCDIYFEPSPKIRGDWCLYYFTKNALKEFTEHVFSRPPSSNFSFSESYQVFYPKTNEPIILIIGAPHLARLQLKEVQRLRAKFRKDVEIYYRPHPRATSGRLEKVLYELGVHIEREIFPAATVIISYSSTLNESLRKQITDAIYILDDINDRRTCDVQTNLDSYLAKLIRNK